MTYSLFAQPFSCLEATFTHRHQLKAFLLRSLAEETWPLYPRLTSLSPDAFPKLRVLASCQMKAKLPTSHRTKIGSATLVDPLEENGLLSCCFRLGDRRKARNLF
uniref:Uncharacterized protein n=1 Tax=Picea glauca TaxID=3330 RepID=A0A101M2Z5_PICGL|nr:hypothetical protein ABT39_MTgene3206 [Picea glauca]